MMQFSDVALLAVVLAAVVCIVILARYYVVPASWFEGRDVEARGARQLAEQKAQSLLREVMGEEEYLREANVVATAT